MSAIMFILIALILTCFVCIVASLMKDAPRKALPSGAYVAESMLNPREVELYRELKSIADKANLCVFAKVRMGNLMNASKDTPEYSKWVSKIKNSYADFILCEGKSMKTLLAVKLDDKGTAPGRTTFQRSGLVDDAFEAAGIPVLHIKNFTPGSLEKALMEKIRGAVGMQGAPKAAPIMPNGGERDEKTLSTT